MRRPIANLQAFFSGAHIAGAAVPKRAQNHGQGAGVCPARLWSSWMEQTVTRPALALRLADAVADFCADLRIQKRSPRTITEHRRVLSRLDRWLVEGELAWDTIRTAQLARFLRRRADDRPAAVFNELSTLRVFYAWALEAELVAQNPARGKAFQTPKRGAPHPRALSVEQVRALLTYLRAHLADGPRQHRDYALIVTALYTGLRAAELAALLWSDIHWSEAGVVVQAGKGNKGRRVKLREDLAAVLRFWQTRQFHGGVGAVFAVEKISPINPNQIGRAVSRYAKLLDLPLTTHVLRHTFATQSGRRSGNVRSVSRALGHSDLRHTERYLAPAMDDSDPAIDSLPGLDAW